MSKAGKDFNRKFLFVVDFVLSAFTFSFICFSLSTHINDWDLHVCFTPRLALVHILEKLTVLYHYSDSKFMKM